METKPAVLKEPNLVVPQAVLSSILWIGALIVMRRGPGTTFNPWFLGFGFAAHVVNTGNSLVLVKSCMRGRDRIIGSLNALLPVAVFVALWML